MWELCAADWASPVPWGESGERSEPGEGFLPFDPRDIRILVYFLHLALSFGFVFGFVLSFVSK